MTDKTFLTVDEAAEFLRVSTRTIYRLIDEGQIAAIRIGKQWRVIAKNLPGYVEVAE